jgi:hypothetical protein
MQNGFFSGIIDRAERMCEQSGKGLLPAAAIRLRRADVTVGSLAIYSSYSSYWRLVLYALDHATQHVPAIQPGQPHQPMPGSVRHRLWDIG